MKYAVVSDVHANYPALQAVLDDVSGSVDGLICLGDLIGLMGYPRETVDTVMNESTYAVKGNHDVAVIEKQEGHVVDSELSSFELNTTWNALGDEHVEWVDGLPSYMEIPDEGLLLAHAQPTPELASGYTKHNMGMKKGKFTAAAAMVDDELFDFILLGHTHEQAVLDCSRFGNDVTVLNPGSVGQPIDGPAEYAVIDTSTGSATTATVEYDGEQVKNRLVELEIPMKWW